MPEEKIKFVLLIQTINITQNSIIIKKDIMCSNKAMKNIKGIKLVSKKRTYLIQNLENFQISLNLNIFLSICKQTTLIRMEYLLLKIISPNLNLTNTAQIVFLHKAELAKKPQAKIQHETHLFSHDALVYLQEDNGFAILDIGLIDKLSLYYQ